MAPTLTLNNEVEMPALGFGVFQTPPEETIDAVETAIREGYRLIDAAPASSASSRSTCCSCTSRCRRPSSAPSTPTGRSRDSSPRQGPRDRREQTSCPTTLDRLLAETSVVPAVNQIEVHPYFQQRAPQRLHSEHGILTQAWSPIGGITSYRGART